MKLHRSRWYRAEDPGTGDTAGGEMTPVNTDWGDMSSDIDAIEPATSAPEPAAPAPTNEPIQTAPVATPPSTAAAEPTAQPQATQPVTTPPAQPAVETPANAPKVYTPEEVAQLRMNYQNELTQFYALSSEDAAALQTQPEVVLPKLAANLHLQVMDTISAQLPRQVMGMIQNYMEQTKLETKAEEDFFAPFPDLKPYRAQVLQVGKMYRAANPNAPKDVAIKVIGDFVRQSLGLPVPNAQPQVTAPANTPTAAFVPAVSSGGGAPAQTPTLWEQMALED